MPHRTHLRTRVLLLTSAFALVLFGITAGLTWRAHTFQRRWSGLLRVDSEAIAVLENFIRAQNGFRARLDPQHAGSANYAVVEQLLDNESIAAIDTRQLRARIREFKSIIGEQAPRREDIESTSNAIVLEARRIADARRGNLSRTIPQLEQDTRALMLAGLALTWIVALISFAAVQTTLGKVVRPIENLSKAADRIASGDMNANVPVGGDYEIHHLGRRLAEMRDKLREHARTDELTGLPNFRAFRERIDDEVNRMARYPAPFGVLVLDLDRFKKYNDTYGHLAGNDALQRVAGAIRETIRTADFAARYGGEEFAVILPESDTNAVAAVAERVRAAIEMLPAPAGGATITVSIGAAMFPLDGRNPEALFHAADGRLYVAKREGRNRVVLSATESVATA